MSLITLLAKISDDFNKTVQSFKAPEIFKVQ